MGDVTHGVRTYPVPLRLQTPLLGAAASMSEIDTFIEGGYGDPEERSWALNVRSKFVSQNLDRICGAAGYLPMGLTREFDEVDVVVALGFNGDLFWSGKFNSTPPPFEDVVMLTDEEVAFTVDAIEHGASGLALRAGGPVAIIGRAAVRAAGGGPAANAKFFAVVDQDDRSAVMELLAIAPGPVIFRRHDGQWQRDNNWLRALRSVKPPPVVTLDPELLAAVMSQVDEATKGKPFDGATASGFDQRLHDMQCEFMALTAAMPAKLQKYWLTGPGAAKIRWFTPGSWRRCYRQLVKYMNPYSARGACTNLSQKLGGHGVATHVGD